IFEVWIARRQPGFEHLKELVERSLPSHGHIVDRIQPLTILTESRQEVRLDDVGNITEIATCFAVSINMDGLVFDHSRDPPGDDGCVSACGVLAWTKDIEVAQADAFHAITLRKGQCIQLVDTLRDGIWRKAIAKH